jgi:hypothetical protein
MESFTEYLNKCVLCGSQPEGYIWFGTESTHDGDASIVCRCGVKMSLEPHDVERPRQTYGYRGKDSFEMRGELLHECADTLIRRWNTWNKPIEENTTVTIFPVY